MEQEQINQIERKITKARFQFAIKCIHKVMQITPKSDIVFSPHSIYEGLLMVYLMSSGAIEERLKLILCLSDVRKYDLIQYYALGRNFEQSKNNASAASSDYDAERRCWIKATNFNHLLPLKNIFNNNLEVFEPDNTPIEKIESINMGIKSAVKNHICNPLKFKVVRDDMEFFLMTVSRLNAPKFQTVDCEFEASYVSIFQDKRKRRSFFSRELNMHVSEFLYTSEKTSLFLLLPVITPADFSVRSFIVNGVSDLIERLSTEQAIDTLRNLLDSDTLWKDAGFSIDPIFNLEVNMSMSMLLPALGIEELLKPDAINLDSFFVNEDSVHLGNAMHRIRIKVTEKYTAAGAVNVIYTGQEILHAREDNIGVGFDFPFIWLIYDKQRRNVLFAGASNDFDYFSTVPSPPRFKYEPVDLNEMSSFL